MVQRIHHKDSKAVKVACKVLEKGGIIVYPTDTLYGFGCDAKNINSIKKINRLKKRTGPLTVITSSKLKIKNWLNVKDSETTKILKMLNGGTTIVVPVHDNIVSNNVCGPNNSLGIRIPNHIFCKALSEEYNNPITSTSVNRTNQPSMIDPALIIKEFSNDIDLIIEDGIISGTGSEIKLYQNGKWTKLR